LYECLRTLAPIHNQGSALPTQTPRPTDGELEILQALWQLGPATVRQVRAHLGGTAGYTTVLKLMQIMTEKGILARVPKGRLHVYRPAQAQEKTQKSLARDLIDRAFGGSAEKLIAAALGSRRASPKELSQIRQLLDQTEGEKP
jgi:BlaI family penicillinase repressor